MTSERNTAGGSEFALGTFATPILSGTSHEAVNEPSTATVGVRAAAMVIGPAEYRLIATWRVPGSVITAGWVMAARQDGDQVVVEMSNGPALGEFTFAGFAVARVPMSEQVWSVAQMAGFKPENLHVGGLAPKVEPIVTLMPIDGFEPGAESSLGAVRITSDRTYVEHVSRHLPGFPVKAQFLRGKVWGWCAIQDRFCSQPRQQAQCRSKRQ
jgi:hypothetical protein